MPISRHSAKGKRQMLSTDGCGFVAKPVAADDRSNDLDSASGTSLVVDRLAALFGPHAGAETNLAGPLHGTLLVGVMHDSSNLFPNLETCSYGGASAVTVTVVYDWFPCESVARNVT